MENEKIEELIDLGSLLRKMITCLRRFWILVLALTVAGGGLMYWKAYRSYRPMYRSEAVFSVSVSYSGNTDIMNYNSYYYDSSAAELVAETFPYILRTDAMKELICQKLGASYINGSISASSVAQTNFFVLTVTSSSAEDAYRIIQAVIDAYPQVSRQVIGETQLTISREPTLASAPYNTFSWQRSTAKGAVAGFVLGMLILVVLALLRKTALTPNDLKKALNLSCLARIPNIKLKQRKSNPNASLLITHQEPDSAFCESFRLLRLKLLRQLKDNDQVIMITSSLPSEGKSSLAANIALSLAKDGKKVLLVDADLRGPNIKSIMNITKPSTGLGECLMEGFDTVRFHRYENTKLFIFAGDQAIQNPTPLLQYDKLQQVIQSMRPMFDYIILDTPPCVMMADASALCSHADKVVYVVREDYASCAQIYDGVQSLSSIGADICGFVFNRSTSIHSSHYGYGYGYGRYGYGKKYGYGYGYSKEKAEK